jgi:N-acetylmuramoyl-L-alanine amidase
VRFGLHEDAVRAVVEAEGPPGWRVTLADGRVEIDSAAAVAAPRSGRGRGLFRAWRAEPGAAGARVVIELAGPARVVRAFVLPGRAGSGERLVVDLAPAAATAAEVIVFGDPPASAGPSPPVPAPAAGDGGADAPLRLAALPAPRPRAGEAPAARSAFRVPPAPRPNPLRAAPLVVVDPGHGGQDPGAVGVNGLFEKTVTLQVGLLLRDMLRARGYRVAMTREADVSVRLRDRPAVARAMRADLFVSLHADSIDRAGVRGMSVYTLSDGASDREAEMLAQRENRADAVAGLDLGGASDDVARTLVVLSQRHTLNESRRFAAGLVAALGERFPLIPRPHRSAGFAVLTAPDVPAVLVEMGYLSSPEDARLLAAGTHQRRVAETLARAVDAHFGRGGAVASRP